MTMTTQGNFPAPDRRRFGRCAGTLVLLAATLVLAGEAFADKRFTRINATPGLAQNNVTSIVQDRHGFMWFGTQDGLHRYDGHRFRIYVNDPDDPTSLSVSFVRFLYVDRFGELWVGAENGGVNRFDEGSDSFIRYRSDDDAGDSLSNDTVLDIKEDAAGLLWVATAKGLNWLDRESDQFVHWLPRNPDATALPSAMVTALAPDDYGGMWVGTDRGLAYLNVDGRVGHVFRHVSGDSNSIGHNDIRTLFVDRAGDVWIGTFGNGVSILNPRTREFRHLTSDRRDTAGLGHPRISRILQDRTGVMWIGTYGGGVTTFDPGTGLFARHRHDPVDGRSLSHDQIRSIYEDRSGLVWIGTGSGGISMFDRRKEQFEHYRHRANVASSLSHNGISSLHVDRNGVLWIGTFGGGLNRGIRAGVFEHLRHDPDDPNSLSSDRIFAVHLDRQGVLWVGTGEDGLNRFDHASGQFKRFVHDPAVPDGLPHNRVRAFLEDSEGRLWVGTYGGGLALFDRSSETFELLRHDPADTNTLSGDNIRVIFEDSAGMIWVGTGTEGLNRLDPDHRSVTRFGSNLQIAGALSHNKIQAIHQTDDDRIWIGTPAGLNVLDGASGAFRQFSRKNGLARDVVYSIVEDRFGALWLSTNKGISRMDPVAETFQNFDVSDGLQGDEFNSGAGAIDQDGYVIFGGINGITRFDPQALSQSLFDPPVLLTDFLLSNQSVAVDSEVERAVLSRPIHMSEKLELTHRDSIVSFEFVALDYAAPSRIQYAYRLSGFDEQWVETESSNRFATFTGLPAGTYELQVRGTNGDGKWSANQAGVTIEVLPPPWRTWWAYSLYVLALLSVIGLYVNAHRRRTRELERIVRERTQELARNNAELEVQKTAAEAAGDAKTAFLATMSHEIRTPLNAVMGMLDLIAESGLSAEQTEYVETIHDSSAALLGIVDQILQYSRLEQGHLEIESIPFNPRRLIRGVATLMSAVAKNKGLGFDLEISDELPRQVVGDPDKLRQIVTNLLSNAIKFTANGKVSIAATFSATRDEGEHLQFVVADTGVGIPAASQESIFDAFSQANETISRRYGGTGMGLAICKELTTALGGQIGFESVENAGTTFWFEIPCAASTEPAMTDRCYYEILLVEDMSVNRRIIAGLLESEGHRVVACASGVEAIHAWRNRRFNVVLLDLHMPEMDGYEVARQIRASENVSSPGVPIFALTAASADQLANELGTAGINGVLTKPLIYPRFVSMLSDFFKSRGKQPDGPTSHAPLLDETVVRDHLRQLGSESVRELYTESADAIDELIEEIDHCRHKGAESLSMTAHKLSGVCKTYGLEALAECAGSIERLAQGDDASELTKHIDRLHGLNMRSREWIDRFLTDLDTAC